MLRNNQLKFVHSVLYIGLSILIFSVLPFLLWKYVCQKNGRQAQNPKYHIQSIIQKGPIKEALKTVYLAEMLQLSSDFPQNLHTFDLKRAQELLIGSGVIASAHLSKQFPSTLEIDYRVREPIAYFSDYSNTVIDSEGVVFPLLPYFTPKILPKIYFGVQIDPFIYGKIEHEKMKIALEIYQLTTALNFHKGLFIDQIDVSKVNAPSLGQREIVLTLYESLGEKTFIRYLRLSKENYEEEFTHFLNLKAMNLPKDLVIDLRLFPNAYLTPLELKGVVEPPHG